MEGKKTAFVFGLVAGGITAGVCLTVVGYISLALGTLMIFVMPAAVAMAVFNLMTRPNKKSDKSK